MSLESATHINDLVTTNPLGTDDRSTADDHIRLIKDVIKRDLPLTGIVTATYLELNVLDGITASTADLNILAGVISGGLTNTELMYVNGVTSAIQTQIDAVNTALASKLESVSTSDIDAGAVVEQKMTLTHPTWLTYFGDGSDGAFTSSSAFTLAGGEYWHTTFNLQATHTLTVTDDMPLIIRATTSITISANITATSNGGAGASSGSAGGETGWFGGSGGAGRGDNSSSGWTQGGDSAAGLLAGGATNAAPGSSVTAARLYQFLASLPPVGQRHIDYSNVAFLCGGGGGGWGAESKAGGQGGGMVVLIAPTITIAGGVTINCGGANGTNAVGSCSASSGGGGGGGGGGCIILAGRSITNNGTLSVAGGLGGSGTCGAAGNGGNGVALTFTFV